MKSSLRERKKELTRQALIDAAERLFEERGFDAVTVAEIADAANVSVKTLFVYFRSKEDLAFADKSLIEAVLAGLAERPVGTSAAKATAEVLITMIENDQEGSGLERFHRGYGQSMSLQSGLLRLWADFEDQITAELAREAGTPPTPDIRLHAIQLVAIIRLATSPEARAAVAGLTPAESAAYVKSMISKAAATITGPDPGSPAHP
ncbi:TetR/AcrR family transcriptional regulator [Nonomuraea jiangxiensis]|uniref:DNA-binding transcriptional regulator, AcrR family n=1 Tax=Nonomuraea jiangxiensis TaxID=633440 RepID=A0A1G9UG27_9ACTN|nr:TetR/AcrR family transcriptional regulator [Nonomuraea jiangxiensis]SDM58882.1 DNA-binding transcriptional regulator, AcrR family [Nonomuraea jiangxiensis]